MPVPAPASMNAAQYDKAHRKVPVQRVPIPEPGPDQYQVKIFAASLCHSDCAMDLQPDSIDRPLTVGHEAVGIISEIHPSVVDKGFRVGDKVGLFYIVDCCFDCEGCKVHGTFCVSPGKGGAKVQGLQADGFFAEYAVTHWRNAIRLPEGLPMDRASPLFCAGITSYHAVDKCGLKAGQWLAVVGCGGLGQLAIRYAKAMDLKVIAIDVNDEMLAVAKQCGADTTLNPQKDPKFVRAVRGLTGLRGCHAAAVFSDSHAAYQTAQRVLTFQGVLCVVGLPASPLKFAPTAIFLRLFRVTGASNGSVFEAQKAIDFSAKHQIIPELDFRRLEDMPQMWEDMSQGKARRRMVVRFCEGESKL